MNILSPDVQSVSSTKDFQDTIHSFKELLENRKQLEEIKQKIHFFWAHLHTDADTKKRIARTLYWRHPEIKNHEIAYLLGVHPNKVPVEVGPTRIAFPCHGCKTNTVEFKVANRKALQNIKSVLAFLRRCYPKGNVPDYRIDFLCDSCKDLHKQKKEQRQAKRKDKQKT